MTEIWKDVPGYEGQYEVSNLGNVKSLERITQMPNGGERTVPEKIMTATKLPEGFVRVTLSSPGKPAWKVAIHHLVMLAFEGEAPGPMGCVPGKYSVDHINKDKKDNRAENLRYKLNDNSIVQGKAKVFLDTETKQEIRRRYDEGGVTYPQLADEYGVAPRTIFRIINNTSK